MTGMACLIYLPRGKAGPPHEIFTWESATGRERTLAQRVGRGNCYPTLGLGIFIAGKKEDPLTQPGHFYSGRQQVSPLQKTLAVDAAPRVLPEPVHLEPHIWVAIRPMPSHTPLQDAPEALALSMPKLLKVDVPTVRTSVAAEHVDLNNHRQVEGSPCHDAAALG